MNITITRTHDGTFGRVEIGEFEAVTVEQEWNNNEPFKSCVPDGEYVLIPFDSPKFGQTFLMVNPQLNVYAFEEDTQHYLDRYLCIFPHKGSYPHNFVGCIGAGESLVIDDSGRMLATKTEDTTKIIIELLKGADHHHLTIKSMERIVVG